jgi:hypothetical protein
MRAESRWVADDQLRQQLVDKYNSVGCMRDEDCVLVTESNRCAFGCGLVFPVSLAKGAQSNLDVVGDMACATCPMPFVPPCVPVVALCSNGHCTTGGPR